VIDRPANTAHRRRDASAAGAKKGRPATKVVAAKRKPELDPAQ